MSKYIVACAQYSKIHSLQIHSAISKQRRPHLHSILLLDVNERIEVYKRAVDKIVSEGY